MTIVSVKIHPCKSVIVYGYTPAGIGILFGIETVVGLGIVNDWPNALTKYPGVPPDNEKDTNALVEPKQLTFVVLSMDSNGVGSVILIVSKSVQLFESFIITEYWPDVIFIKFCVVSPVFHKKEYGGTLPDVNVITEPFENPLHVGLIEFKELINWVGSLTKKESVYKQLLSSTTDK